MFEAQRIIVQCGQKGIISEVAGRLLLVEISEGED
jgi:hypothetical protein